MNSTTALLTRSLRMQARSSGPHAARVGLLVLLAMLLVSSSGVWASGGAAGRHVLGVIGWCLLLIGTLAAIPQFAGAIAEEKEEGNLALLRMAGLGPSGLLVGIGLARLWDMLLLGACSLPVAVLAVTLGGVALEQVAALYAAILAWFCALAGLGLLASTVAATAARAGSLLTGLLFALHGLPYIAWGIAASVDADGVQALITAWLEQTVWWRVGSLGGGATTGLWAWQLLIDPLLGAGGVALALLLHRRLEARGGGAEAMPAAAPVRRRLPIGRPRPGLRAIAWKDFHTALGGWRLLIIKGVAVITGAVLLAVMVHGDSYLARRVGQIWMIVALAWVVIETALHASRLWSTEVREHTAELLLMLPHERAAVAWSKLLVLPAVLAPALLWFAAGAVLAPGTLLKAVGEVLSEIGGWYGVVVVLFWWHLAAWLSLVRPRSSFAGSLVAVVLVQFGLGIVASIMRSGDGVFLLGTIALALATAWMHVDLPRRWAARV